MSYGIQSSHARNVYIVKNLIKAKKAHKNILRIFHNDLVHKQMSKN